MYHNFSASSANCGSAVSVGELRKQFEYLRRHFHVVSLSHLVDRLVSGAPIEKFTVALTVDDGRRNFYNCCFPLLKEFAIPATLFVVSAFIRGDDWIWTDKVLWLAEQPSAPTELAFPQIEQSFAMLNRMRPEARNAQIYSWATAMQVEIPNDSPPNYAPCSWSELREMADSGLVEIGSHTVTHAILSSLSDEESRFELRASRAEIEKGTGRSVKAFCFPNGKPVDYRASHLQQVQDAGYSCSVAASFGMVSKTSNVYELPRIGVSGHTDFLSFAKYVDGTEHYQSKIQASLGLRDSSP